MTSPREYNSSSRRGGEETAGNWRRRSQTDGEYETISAGRTVQPAVVWNQLAGMESVVRNCHSSRESLLTTWRERGMARWETPAGRTILPRGKEREGRRMSSWREERVHPRGREEKVWRE